MLHVNDNGIISLTRGDTARLNIDISNDASGEAYTLNDEDILHFTLKRKTTDPAALIHKTLSGSTTLNERTVLHRTSTYSRYHIGSQKI